MSETNTCAIHQRSYSTMVKYCGVPRGEEPATLWLFEVRISVTVERKSQSEKKDNMALSLY